VITPASFREDFPEFSNVAKFPDSQIEFYQNFARLLLNQRRWGPPNPFRLVTAALVSPGAGYAVNEGIALAGGEFTCPVSLKVLTLGAGDGVATFEVTSKGAYTVPPNNPVQQLNATGAGLGATFDLTFSAKPNAMYDIAMELFIAHNMVLEARAMSEALLGNVPGVTTGPISAKAVDKVSVNYATADALDPANGHWNLSIYGTRFIQLVNLFGMGPVYVGGAIPPQVFNGLDGPAWEGPWPWPSPTGFSS
jgi:hypothetical protein